MDVSKHVNRRNLLKGGSALIALPAILRVSRASAQSAAFKIGLLRRDGHWMIHNFHVDPAGSSPAGGKGA